MEKGKSMEINVVNIDAKFSKFTERLSYKIIARMNDIHFKLVRSYSDFVWHRHPETDEVFMVIDGDFQIDLREKTLSLNKGDMVVIPKG
jgi:mannose-6-phosphate isomerase-like protein (cupin superfamily)